MGTIECGREARKHFTFDEGYVNYNHGSYGATPDVIRARQRTLQDAADTRPDLFIRHEYPKLSLASREALAAHLGVPRRDVVLVPNASTGLNVVLHNLVYNEGDVALHFSTTYNGIIAALRYLTETTPLSMHEVNVSYMSALSDSSVCNLFIGMVKEVREQGKQPRLAVFDTITSKPGIRCPFEQLTAICRKEGILSVIDAAHSVGQIPLDLPALDPDFFVANLHKWLYVPRSCAMLYVARRNQHLLRSNFPTSALFVPRGQSTAPKDLESNTESTTDKLSAFEIVFEFWSTLDSSAYLVIPEVLAWRSRLTWKKLKGEDAIHAYLECQAREAGKLVAGILGTTHVVMENEDRTLGKCAFANVRLPLSIPLLYGKYEGHDNADKMLAVAQFLSDILVNEHKTFIAIYFQPELGLYYWWARLSAQIYLTMDDWDRAARLLRDVCDRAKARKWT